MLLNVAVLYDMNNIVEPSCLVLCPNELKPQKYFYRELEWTVVQRFVMWVLDEVPGSIPGRSDLGNDFPKLVLVWVFCVVSRGEFYCSDTHSKKSYGCLLALG